MDIMDIRVITVIKDITDIIVIMDITNYAECKFSPFFPQLFLIDRYWASVMGRHLSYKRLVDRILSKNRPIGSRFYKRYQLRIWIHSYFKRNLKIYKNAQLTSGLNMCISPSVAPGKVIPRIKNIVMTIYGNPAVK